MIDQAKIFLNFMRLKQELFDDPEAFRVACGLPHLDVRVSSSGKKGTITARISLVADDAVVITAVRRDGCWYAWLVEFNLGKLLHGHNAIPITRAAMLCAALSELQAVMQLVLEKSADAKRLIPGLPGSRSHWSMIELSLNLGDPDRVLVQAFLASSHPAIRNEPMSRGNWRKLPGTHLVVRTYAKDEQMAYALRKSGVTDVPPRMARIEFVLMGPRLKESFKSRGDLAGFDLLDLREAHVQEARKLLGVFVRNAGDSKASKLAKFIAALVRDGRGSREELQSLYERINMPHRNTRSTLKSDITRALEEFSPIAFDDVLTDEAYFLQPSIRIPKLERFTRATWLRDRTDLKIVEIYGGAELWPKDFRPHFSEDELIDDSPYILNRN
ncbi:hypothetical protein [Haloferula sp. BvORR071]|uniref:hypothetical protein n=1 Tax=Haloferula sp. BvORR071 TaxID=1396141 RepID=UPI0005549BD0|nr:hypothetical protein [Haloferula sp. BvORR071]